MVRITPTVLSGTILVCAAIGCANLAETQAITQFTAALEKGDIDKLRASSSDKFDEKALRRDDALDAMKILKLRPEEKLTVVKVEDVSDTEKKVIVTRGKSKQKMLYKLVRDKKGGKWVVDDIVVKQNKKDVSASKSVTEQMDLLLVIQDFLVAWHSGKKEEVQAVTTNSFAKLLGELPASHLERLTKKVAGERIRSDEFRPEATIDGSDAIVKLQRAKGVLVLTMQLTNKGWRVSDVAVESRKDKDQMASARKTATAIRAVVEFLKAYKNEDKDELKRLTAEKFFKESLKVAELKTVPLPTPDVLGDKDVVKTHDKGGEYILERGAETVKISLSCPKTDTGETISATFLVDDVTIYSAKEEKRISALFTAQAKMRLFVDALIHDKLPLVSENSTKDLTSKVWSKLGPVTLAEILPQEIEMSAPVITGKDFHGSVIKIHVHQGSRELTYVMRDWLGKVTVDDVLMPVMDRPTSMKETMQALLPIRLLAASLREASVSADPSGRQLDVLRNVTSTTFNKLVWSQVSQIPEAAFTILPQLDAALVSITETPNGQTVLFGDDRFGSKVELVRERDTLVIDRITLLAGGKSEPTELKHLLKNQVAKHGPRGMALDPMSSNPIATEPTRTADADAAEIEPKSTATNGDGPSDQDPPVQSAEAPAAAPQALRAKVH